MPVLSVGRSYLVSPPLPDITRVNETAAMVAGLLNLPDAAPVDNPLERTRYMLDDGGVRLALVHGRTDARDHFVFGR